VAGHSVTLVTLGLRLGGSTVAPAPPLCFVTIDHHMGIGDPVVIYGEDGDQWPSLQMIGALRRVSCIDATAPSGSPASIVRSAADLTARALSWSRSSAPPALSPRSTTACYERAAQNAGEVW